MNSFTHQIKDSRQQSEIQSFYEPALRVLGHLFEVKKQNLRNKGYDENNAAVTRDEFMQALSEQHRMPIFHAGQIISSLYQAKRIRYLGSTFIQMNEEESK
ncbi:hypothetical protein F985_01889 [Acinetobacter seifertii]|uniref:Uncharacterized protein n=1 Tax=Acinetobacter seifertii TaxID=1530123 RepID=N8SBM6_9GAMM|nr:hypothetical protein [Acinetobacter seifertii]ENU43179.1 hypothetical protein F985_01889 [Acinetobacter seifertii]